LPRPDLCTKRLLRCIFHAGTRYKTDSAAKWLIFNDLLQSDFFRRSSEALDFAGLAGHRTRAINKVIHTNLDLRLNRFLIKDLSAVCEINLNFNR
jgi:hypothetical protein